MVRIARVLTVQGTNPAETELFAPFQTSTQTRPDYRVLFKEVKRPGLGVDHQPHLAQRLEKE